MNIKLLFLDMNRKLEQISMMLLKKNGHLDDTLEQELNKLAEQSAEIAEEWLKFEEKLGQVLGQEKLLNREVKSEEWLKGKAMYDLFMFAGAIPYLESVVQQYPEFEQAKLYLAHAYLEEKKYEQARYYLQFLIKTTDDEENLQLAYHTLGCLEGMLKNYGQASYYFEKIKTEEIREEWKATFMFNHALALFQEKKYDACLEKLIEYYQLAPEDWKGPYMLGKVYLALGDEEAGISFWFEALQLQENIKLLKEMARHFEEKAYFQMAAQCYQRVLEDKRHAFDKEAWYGLAWSYGLAYKQKISQDTFLKALSLFPQELDMQISYAWLLLLWNQQAKAQKLISRLVCKYPDHPLVKGLPLLYEGKYREALQFLTTV